ncbi:MULTISPECIES: hypothetical protein [unclassified Streptomyces]|jgi:hypothetical protein|uniref:hypothetical protein n=1 Tax=unclassified Streptomyces TaxID=2593676 RepID=UPI000FFF6010|nr:MULTISPECIES: hypothetical protein [unclassified Streptomyces]
MTESSDLLTTARQQHLAYYRTLSEHLPELDGDVIAAAHQAIRALTSPRPGATVPVPVSAYAPVIEAVAAAVEYCEFTGHGEGVRYYRYWHALLLADQTLGE